MGVHLWPTESSVLNHAGQNSVEDEISVENLSWREDCDRADTNLETLDGEDGRFGSNVFPRSTLTFVDSPCIPTSRRQCRHCTTSDLMSLRGNGADT
jgi:hypothetical protein